MISMESKWQDKLVAIFSKYTITELEERDCKLLLQELSIKGVEEFGKSEYSKLYGIIRDFKKRLDEIKEKFTGLEQVKVCFTLLKEEYDSKHKNDFQILSSLIYATFYQTIWKESEKKYYGQAYDMLVNWKDFFFSYTNRNLPETNNDFKKLINRFYDKVELERNKTNINYLAKLIVKFLTQHNLSSFFDQDNLRCGEEIGELVEKNCKCCYAFVQLVERELFRIADQQKNWCFVEFKEFSQWVLSQKSFENNNYNRHYFIWSRNEIIKLKPANFPKEYESWLEKMQNVLGVPLDPTQIDKFKFENKMRELADEIVKVKASMLKDVIQ